MGKASTRELQYWAAKTLAEMPPGPERARFKAASFHLRFPPTGLGAQAPGPWTEIAATVQLSAQMRAAFEALPDGFVYVVRDGFMRTSWIVGVHVDRDVAEEHGARIGGRVAKAEKIGRSWRWV